ncbi:MAG TPA: glycerophosphodiester phosphodiesterase family protein [Candidatus Polarisedimenticolaceae bacterium]|nr:glycerophosphodiester phosphodiesterase family protein [Candidatus Polarisedimenticolaceae bacterium]
MDALRRAGSVIGGAARRFGHGWVAFVEIDLLYKAIGFAILTPLIGLLFKLLIARSGRTALADVDIALFFFTTRPGVVALLLVSGLVVAVSALEQACLMATALSRERGNAPRVRDAFAFVAARSFAVLRLTVQLVARVLSIVAPFAAAIGGVYWIFLRRHDINYFLAAKPPEFLAAVAVAGVVAAVMAFVLARKIAAWLLVLPIVVFEGTLPIRAFGESARRMSGRRVPAALALAAWAAFAVVAPLAANAGLRASGRGLAPLFGATLAGMLAFIGFALVVALVVTLAVAVVVSAMFALVVIAFYVETAPATIALPKPYAGAIEIEGKRFPISWKALTAIVVVAVPATALLANFLMKATWTDHPVLVFAHRGASIDAPENTLAALKLAGQEGTDFVELDVQESRDGIVLVAHDADLMKIGRSPLKIWESDAAALRAVDIGSYRGPQFASERVPTLAEALDACKGVCKVDIELKDYGHDERLEERVAEIVEAAGMQDHIVTMSLSAPMTAKMKQLRPQWTSGLLVAKAMGDASRLPGDFLAVQASMATRAFIRHAHAAGKSVYVWTIDDPAKMLRYIGLGVDGLITNRPALAKRVVADYAAMPPAQRLLVFVMTRLGATGDAADLEQ